MIATKLYEQARRHLGICLGLDTTETVLPAVISARDESVGEKFFAFNRRVVDATCDTVACYKLQIACYEAHGLDGLAAYAKTLQYIRAKGKIVIADVKRGDILSTAEQYAKAHFTGEFEADYLTLNAYMGEDAVSPYYDYIKNRDKGVFVLVKTSNPSGPQLQNLTVQSGKPAYLAMAELVSGWGAAFVEPCGYTPVGAVIGLTYASEFAPIAQAMPGTFFLIPGYGAQGGTGKDIAALFQKDICGVVNSSRGLIGAHLGKNAGDGFDGCVREAVLAMREDIAQWL